jgi:hypothetical protein
MAKRLWLWVSRRFREDFTGELNMGLVVLQKCITLETHASNPRTALVLAYKLAFHMLHVEASTGSQLSEDFADRNPDPMVWLFEAFCVKIGVMFHLKHDPRAPN